MSMEGSSFPHLIGLVAAVVLGALIGLERQLRHHTGGLHFHALVSLGSAAFVLAGTVIGDPTGPARVAGQVVTGVGFLCAGLVLHQGTTVRNLHTAATAWCASAVGVLAGLSLTIPAAVVAVLVIATNVVLHACEHLIPGLRPPGDKE